MKSPAFQFYPKDLLTSQKVAVMTTEELGAYWLLCSHAWLSDHQGTLPNDDRLLARLARLTDEAWPNHRSTIMAPFVLKGELWHHPRLLEEWQKQQEWREKSRAGGIRSGESRRLRSGRHMKGGSRVVEPKANTAVCSLQSASKVNTIVAEPKSSAPSAFPGPSGQNGNGFETHHPAHPAAPCLPQAEWFGSLWKQYPVKLGRKEAWRHFKASVKNEDDWRNIQQALANYIARIKADKTAPRYIKHGDSWVNNWRDYLELEPAMAGAEGKPEWS